MIAPLVPRQITSPKAAILNSIVPVERSFLLFCAFRAFIVYVFTLLDNGCILYANTLRLPSTVRTGHVVEACIWTRRHIVPLAINKSATFLTICDLARFGYEVSALKWYQRDSAAVSVAITLIPL